MSEEIAELLIQFKATYNGLINSEIYITKLSSEVAISCYAVSQSTNKSTNRLRSKISLSHIIALVILEREVACAQVVVGNQGDTQLCSLLNDAETAKEYSY